MSADAEEHTGEDVVKNKIFIVHGHDEALKYQLSNWLREIELEPIILHEQANGGVTSILGKLERYSDVDCAIVLFTADDEGYEKGKPKERKLRARQNVVFEAGLFVGRLGAKPVSYTHLDLKRMLPDVKSFSETNLRYMQKFAELYAMPSNLPQLGEDLERQIPTTLFAIPWGHHKLIMDKCKNCLLYTSRCV